MRFEITIEDLNVKPDGKYNPLDTICLAKESDLYPEILDDYFIFSKMDEINKTSDVMQEHFNTMIYWYKIINNDNSKRKEINSFNNALISFLGTTFHCLESLKTSCTTEYYTKITHHFFDRYLSYRLLYEMRNISQHKPKNISIFINEKSQLCLSKSLLFNEYKISKKVKDGIVNLLAEEIDLVLHINTFFMNILEMKEWIFVENIDIKKLEKFFRTISKYKLDKNTYIRKKYENGNIDYLVLTSNFQDVVGNSIEIYNKKFSVIGKELGYNFNYINYFEQ